MLIHEINEIKSSIISQERLISSNNIVKHLNEKTVKSINCYAYALGIMHPGKIETHYFPGFTSNYNPEPKKYKDNNELIRSVCRDLVNLSFNFKIIKLNENLPILKNDEYLIKLFYLPPLPELPNGDSHFIRKSNQSNVWFHKMGWFAQPTLTTLNIGKQDFILGAEPDKFAIYDPSYKKTFVYKAICYFAISKD